MKTYIYTGASSLISMEGNDVSTINTVRNDYLNIDWAWIIEEDGIFHNGKETYEVKKGDVVLVLYARYKEDDNRRTITIINSPVLYENFLKNKEYEKAEKAKSKIRCENCCCDEPVA